MAAVKAHASAPGVRWIFPRAGRRDVTILGGSSALTWCDVASCDRSCIDEAGIERATAMICGLVREERARDPFGRRVTLMGFSLGGALALNAGLRLQGEIDGIVALATALPFPDRVPKATPQSPPIFFGHGLFDTKVPYPMGRESRKLLASLRYETEWHTYAYSHSTGRRQLCDVSRWLQNRFLEKKSAVRFPSGQATFSGASGATRLG